MSDQIRTIGRSQACVWLPPSWHWPHVSMSSLKCSTCRVISYSWYSLLKHCLLNILYLCRCPCIRRPEGPCCPLQHGLLLGVAPGQHEVGGQRSLVSRQTPHPDQPNNLHYLFVAKYPHKLFLCSLLKNGWLAWLQIWGNSKFLQVSWPEVVDIPDAGCGEESGPHLGEAHPGGCGLQRTVVR